MRVRAGDDDPKASAHSDGTGLVKTFLPLWVTYIVVKTIQIVFYPDPYLASDTGEYLWSAVTFRANPYKPFGYSAFLAVARTLLPFPLGVLLLQSLVKLIAVTALGETIRRIYAFPRATVLAVSAIILFDPLALLLDHYLMSDSFFLSASLLTLAGLLAFLKRSSWVALAVTIGFALLATAVRFVGLALPVLAIVSILLYRRRRWVASVAVVSVCTIGLLLGLSTQMKRELGTFNTTTFDGWAFYGNLGPLLEFDADEIAAVEDEEIRILYDYFAAFPADLYALHDSDWHRWSPDSPAKELLYAFAPKGHGTSRDISVSARVDSFAVALRARAADPASGFHDTFATYRERFRPDEAHTQPYHHAYVFVNALLRDFCRHYLSANRMRYLREFHLESVARVFVVKEVFGGGRYRERTAPAEAVAAFWPGEDTSTWRPRYGDVAAPFETWYAWIYGIEWMLCGLALVVSFGRRRRTGLSIGHHLTGVGSVLFAFALIYGVAIAYSHMTEARYVGAVLPFAVVGALFLVNSPGEPWTACRGVVGVVWTRRKQIIAAAALGGVLAIATGKVIGVMVNERRPLSYEAAAAWLEANGNSADGVVVEDALRDPDWREIGVGDRDLLVVRIPLEKSSPMASDAFYDPGWFGSFAYIVLRDDLLSLYEERVEVAGNAPAFHVAVARSWTEVARLEDATHRGPGLRIYANPAAPDERSAVPFHPEVLERLDVAPARLVAPFTESYGQALVRRGKLRDALAIYGAATRLCPGEEAGFYNYGAVAVELRGDRAQSYNNLGVARAGLGDVDGAITAFRRALMIDPTHERAAANLRIMEDMRDGNPEAGASTP